MTINKRVKAVRDHYCKNRQEFADKLGISLSEASKMTSIDYPIGKKKVTQIITAFPNINPNWVLFGTGDMFLDPSKEGLGAATPYNAKQVPFEFVNVPLIPIRARAGYLEGYGDPEYIGELPTFPVMTDKTFHGNYRCFEVEGDSMDNQTLNSILDGDVVLGREIKKDLWHSKLHINQWKYFAIVHKDGILIKQIVDHNVDTGEIVCHSLNNWYGDDFKLKLAEVYELYNIIKIVDRPIK